MADWRLDGEYTAVTLFCASLVAPPTSMAAWAVFIPQLGIPARVAAGFVLVIGAMALNLIVGGYFRDRAKAKRGER